MHHFYSIVFFYIDCPNVLLYAKIKMTASTVYDNGHKGLFIVVLYHGVRLRQRVHTVTISRSAATHAERLPIEHGPRRTLWVIGGRVAGYT